MADLELYKDAILTVDLPSRQVTCGRRRHGRRASSSAWSGEIGYSVEFFDMTGRTVAVVTVPASHLRVPTSADLPSVREVSKAPSSIALLSSGCYRSEWAACSPPRFGVAADAKGPTAALRLTDFAGNVNYLPPRTLLRWSEPGLFSRSSRSIR